MPQQCKSVHLESHSLLPSSLDDQVKRLVETQQLEGSLSFPNKGAYDCYYRCIMLARLPFSLCCFPLGLFCPHLATRHNGLKLEKDQVELKRGFNDCCCHIAKTEKSVPLDKIQDVELVESCILTCFGLKQVNVQTAGNSGPESGAEIMVEFLANPDQAREAIKAAVRAYRQAKDCAGPPVQAAGMSRTAGQVGVAGRVLRLTLLVTKGILSAEDVGLVRGAVLVSPTDPTLHFMEALELVERGELDKELMGEMRVNFMKTWGQ